MSPAKTIAACSAALDEAELKVAPPSVERETHGPAAVVAKV
jgi:hypothetical protein